MKLFAFIRAGCVAAVLVVFVQGVQPVHAEAVIGSVAAGRNPMEIAINPATNTIYVANRGDNTLTVVDGATLATTTVPVPTAAIPGSIAVNPVSNRIYVVHSSADVVTVIDGASNATSVIPVAKDPIALVVNPRTNRIYVASFNGKAVTVIDGANGATTVLPMPDVMWAIAVNQTSNTIIALSPGVTIALIDGATNAVTPITLDKSSPGRAAINERTNKIYVTHGSHNIVNVIDGATRAVITIPVGPGPYGAAVNPVTNRIYVPSNGGDSVAIIDGATNATSFINVGNGPGPLALNETTGILYIATHPDDRITVLDTSAKAQSGGIVVEFRHPGLDHYFITADPNEIAAVDSGAAGSGWVRTGLSFKAGGATAVCRFYGRPYAPGPNSHFYTASAAECAALKAIPRTGTAHWNFESLDFTTTPPVNGAFPSGTVRVLRAYNDAFRQGKDSNHRITIDPAAISEVVARGWIAEGVVMCAPV